LVFDTGYRRILVCLRSRPRPRSRAPGEVHVQWHLGLGEDSIVAPICNCIPRMDIGSQLFWSKATILVGIPDSFAHLVDPALPCILLLRYRRETGHLQGVFDYT